MGFVFGYQNSSNFYLFDWKKASQGYVGRTAAEGMTVKKFTGGTGNGLVDLSLEELWENQVDFGDMSVLATNHSATAGWVTNVDYTFHLDFLVNPCEIGITIMQGATTLWDTTFSDATFSSGQFGFYNYSQSDVRYAGFVQTGGVTVPEPGVLVLLLSGLIGLGSARGRRSASDR